MRRVLVLLALVALAAPVRPQDKREIARRDSALQALKAELRALGRASNFGVREAEQVRILKDIARLDTDASAQFLVDTARDPKFAHVKDDVLDLLDRYAPDSTTVAALFKEHMALSNPHRALARGYLLRRAVRRYDEKWLKSLYEDGSIEDRFLALQGLGQIGDSSAFEAARGLASDPEWSPRPGTVLTCGTIAKSLKNFEGAAAARLLLLLRQDPRFTARDADDLREATRLWSRRDLRDYVGIVELADADPAKRAESAAFMGAAGLEEARAPLLQLARDASQPVVVRTKAVESLGRMRIARHAMARTLGDLAHDTDAEVARAAVSALGRLGVRQAAAELVELLDGARRDEAAAALAALSGKPADTDWRAWFSGPDCRLPVGA